MIEIRGTVLVGTLAVLLGCGNVPHQLTSTAASSTGSADTTASGSTAIGGTGSSGSAGSGSTTGSGSASDIPSNAKIFSDIQKMTDWSSCSSSCAGQPGTNAVYSMGQGIANPSLSGSANQYNITGGTPWAAALWWKQIGGNDSATHFVYDLSFYLIDADAAQALEFNVNQNALGHRYEYATQCDIKGSHQWRIWPHAQMQWMETGAPCPVPLIGQWNHLTWEFARNAQNQVVWVSVTLNGLKSAINMSFDSYAASGSGIDVAFQMDSNGVPTPWSVWVDKISLTYW